MKAYVALLLACLVLFFPACQRKKTICPEGSVAYVSDRTAFPPLSEAAQPGQTSSPVTVEIRGKQMKVDRLIEGPLCNEHLSGRIYVGCNLQIARWEKKPTFLKDCDFTVDPGTVVYVAAHNDQAMMKGCACHTGKLQTHDAAKDSE